MITIFKKQLLVFNLLKYEEFIIKAVGFIKLNFPEWCREKMDDDVKKYILFMIQFSEKYNIYTEINVIKLIEYKLEFNFDLVKYKVLENTLMNLDISEDERIANFYLNLESGNYKLQEILIS
ncbi:MAG TPA: hypothetical protein PLP23_10555 [Panacibacter sp.]|nr:hypothetical protein [Panacibacter sp.]